MSAQYIKSYYSASLNFIGDFPFATANYRCDVCVIGGGFTGIATALHLVEAGFNVILLEANKLGWGASGRNGGQLHSGQRLPQTQLEKLYGINRAHELWQLAQEAKHLVKNRIIKHAIQCDYKSGLLHAAYKKSDIKDFQSQVIKLRRDYNYNSIKFVDKQDMSQMLGTDIYYGGMLDEGGGHLHPLNYLLGLAKVARDKGVKIFENSKVISINKDKVTKVKTEKATISTDYLVMACNGHLDTLDNRLASKIMPINNFIIATKPLDSDQAKQLIADDVAVADSKFVVDYYRLSGDKRLLFGGGENYSRKFPDNIIDVVRPKMLKVFPQLSDIEIDYAWGGTLAITRNRLPSIGIVDNNTYYAQGFSGQGVALTTLVGKLISEAISGNNQSFELMNSLEPKDFPGGTLLRYPALIAGMLYYRMKDRI